MVETFTVTGLSIFDMGHARAIFQLSEKISLSIEMFIIWTIGDVIQFTTGLRNLTGFILVGIVEGKCIGIWDLIQQLLIFLIYLGTDFSFFLRDLMEVL